MDQSLTDAAQQGSIDALYALIRRDANVLDRIDEIPFVDSPLHIAAFAGQIRFAMEIMKLKPSFARKLNQDGFTPMHLALQKHHDSENDEALQKNLILLVERLLDVDKDLVRVQGKEGVTLMHYAAQTENLHLLKKFIQICPNSLQDVTTRQETVLHVALKYDKVEAFKLLLRWIRWAWFKDVRPWMEKLLYQQDDEGNTLLHIAVSRNQSQVVSWLLRVDLVDVEAKNLVGQTVFDILDCQSLLDNQMLKNMLPPRRCVIESTGSHPSKLEKMFVTIRRNRLVITEERRNTLLVVAALLITVTYQAALISTPDQQPNGFNCTGPPINATGANHFNCQFIAGRDTVFANPFNSTYPIELTSHGYKYTNKHMKKHIEKGDLIFFILNTINYLLTNVTLFFLLPPDFIGRMLCLLLGLLFSCYCISTPVVNAIGFSGLYYLLPLFAYFVFGFLFYANLLFEDSPFVKDFSFEGNSIESGFSIFF